MSDLKFAIRQLAKNPGFTAVAALTLAICLGANLSIFAVIDSVLLQPLPFPQANRLVTMFNSYPKADIPRSESSLANYYERRGTLSAFSEIAAVRAGTAIIGDPGATVQEDVMRVSPEFFRTLGVWPTQGRSFTDEEMTYQTEGETIIADSYWRHEFHSDPSILGRQIRLDGFPKTIIGVLPPSFRFLSSKARIYLPLSSAPEDREIKQRHSNQDVELFGRLKPGVSLATAQAQLDADNAAHAAEYPNAQMVAAAGFRTLIRPLHLDHVMSIRPTLLLLQAGVLLLLFIGAVNVVNLILIQATGRTRELAIRLSLGATRRHVIRQVMTETVLLISIGGAFGLAVGAAGIRLLTTLGVHQLPLGAQVEFNGRLALVAMLTALTFGIAIGSLIAFLSLRGQAVTALQSEPRGGTAGHAAQRLRQSFIVVQVALAFILLAGGGLLGLSPKRAMAVNPGFPPDHLLTGRIALPWKSYPDWPPRLAFLDRFLKEMREQPGVSAAGVINIIPFNGEHLKTAFTVTGHVPRPGESIQGHYFYGVDGDVFAALGIPLREGRFIGSADSDKQVCVVDEDFSRRYWPEGHAMGQRLFVGPKQGSDAEAFTVVGVVSAIKQAELTERQGQGAVYFPYKYRTDVGVFTVVRTTQRPESFALTLQKIVRRIDPDLPVTDLRSMEIRIADTLLVRRSPAMLAGIFAGVALLLAAIGTYGVLAHAVSQRRREIGVRMALGALPKQIGNQFLSQGLRLLAAGSLLGMIGAWLAGRAMQSILFEVPPMPVTILTSAMLIMTVVSLLACWLPARRATRVDPIEALRYE